MTLVFSADDVKIALAKYARVSPNEIKMADGLPETIASTERVAQPARTGRMRGSRNKATPNTEPGFNE